MSLTDGSNNSFTTEDRLRWYYAVSRIKGARLTERDYQRLDDWEELMRKR